MLPDAAAGARPRPPQRPRHPRGSLDPDRLCKHLGIPFVFPGSATQWNGVTDMTDATILAEQMVWAATTDAGASEAFNVVNGDVFRWRAMWPKIAAYFGVKPEGFVGEPRPLEVQMVGMEPV